MCVYIERTLPEKKTKPVHYEGGAAFDGNIQSAQPQGELFHSDTHSPPLAYSITRYKVFSVSITSNSLTGGRERKAGGGGGESKVKGEGTGKKKAKTKR